MARHRSKKKKPKTTRQSVEFVVLPSRNMVVWEADLTAKNDDSAMEKYFMGDDRLQDALVKPTIKYNEGDEERARHVEKGMVEHAKRFAEHVYPTERIVVKTSKTKMPDLTPLLTPLEAAKIWMRERPPKVVSREDVLKALKRYLWDVPDGAFDREEPVPFILGSISGSDFGPFGGEFSVGPLGEGVYSVGAKYEGQQGRSNRAGKTALVSVVRQAMYGDLRKGKDQTKLIHGSTDRAVAGTHLVGTNGKDLISIGRQVGKSGSGAVVDGNKCNITQAIQEFANRVRLKRDDFIKTCFIGEGDLHGVLGQTAAPIMADMTRWMGLDGWVHICKAVSNELAGLTKEMELEAARRGWYEERIERGCPDKKEIDRQRDIVAELMDAAKEGEVKRVAVRDLKNTIERSGVIQEALEASKGDMTLRKRLKAVRKAKDSAERDVKGPAARLAVLDGEITSCQNAMAGFDGVCPVDSGECPRASEINENDGAMEKKLEGLRREFGVVEEKESRLRHMCDEMTDKIQNITRGLRVVADADDVLEKYGRKPQDVGVLKRRLVKLENEERDGKDKGDLGRAQNILTEMLVDVKAVGWAVKEVKKIGAAIKGLEQKARLLRYVKLITGRQGIPLMQVQNASRSVETDANTVLAMLRMDCRLEFVFDVALKKKEAECGDCGREFQKGERRCPACSHTRTWARVESFIPMVREGVRVQSFDQDSGGGKSMLAFAMRVALARFLGLSLLMIDEVDTRLDCVNLDAFVALLPKLKRLGFIQVFVISHRPQVAEAIPNRIEVVRFSDEQRSEVKLLIDC